jgi:hypothetical protein
MAASFYEEDPAFALGTNRSWRNGQPMSAIGSELDLGRSPSDVASPPTADIGDPQRYAIHWSGRFQVSVLASYTTAFDPWGRA